MGAVPAGVAAGDNDGTDGAVEEGQGAEAASRTPGLPGVEEDEDEDRVDAKNAASRLATSTF